jgi:hypothetical protein
LAVVEFMIEFGGEPQDVTITTSGIADVEGSRRLTYALASDPRYRAGMLLLVDHSDLEMSRLSDLDLERIAAAITESDWNLPPRAVAIVASNLETHVRAREAVAHLGGSRSNRRVFGSREEALAWLESKVKPR